MTESSEGFDPRELAAAERLDREIADTLAGRPSPRTDPVALWLAGSLRSTAPKRLRQRPTRQTRAWLPRLAAFALAGVLAAHGISNQFLSEWVASSLGEPHSPHAAIEGGWALIAVAIAVGAGALRRRWLPVSVGAGVPLGVAMAAGGVSEFGVFPLGAVLHTVEGLLALVLFATWWFSARYSLRRRPEGRA